MVATTSMPTPQYIDAYLVVVVVVGVAPD